LGKLIYLADDEENIRDLMKTFLECEGFEVKTFADGTAIRKAFDSRVPDMVILDLMMPGEDGLSICRYFRRESTVPIIIVSAKDTPLDRVTGITMGSDDYITKPFLPLELTARVKALFRRIEMTEAVYAPKGSVACGNVTIDPVARKVQAGETVLNLTHTEFDFLFYLMSHKPTAVPRQELLKAIWKFDDACVDTRVSDDLVKRLRKKMKDGGATVQIETVWGFGYRLIEE